ncbi:MAG: 50S ribosomal protein L9 [Phycisphaeraceae bacterium]|nr:50S ribosomal protein L9 [Phycisphaeraceae bacterium]
MKTIKLLLTTNVENLGIVGEVVQVKPGFARNYLLPRGMAADPTDGNIARLAERRKEVEEQMKKLRSEQEAMITRMKEVEVTLMRSANEQGVLFGGVSQHDIAEAIREEGYAIEDRAVRVGEQIKRLDSYEIPIVLANDLKTEIKLWVVSDKPAEQLNPEGEGEEGEGESEEAPEGEGAEEAAVAES